MSEDTGLRGETTNAQALRPQPQPTLYFIGVTTKGSSIMKVFPEWARVLGLDAQIVGYDAPLHAEPDTYRRIVDHIRTDPLSRGALVTTHKIDLLEAAGDVFDDLDHYAKLCGEVSCISKRDGRLIGHAKDPITSGLSWEAFVPKGHWGRTDGQVLCLGAGGSGTAVSVYAAERTEREDRPRRFTLVDRSEDRFRELERVHGQLDTDMEFDYVVNGDPARNDQLLGSLPPGSLVINATGMGKDVAGSPITDAGRFPEGGLAWEFNYRGELDFLQQARAQQGERGLTVEDGWVYFLHGWSQVIAEVFDIDLTPERFRKLDEAAAWLRPANR